MESALKLTNNEREVELESENASTTQVWGYVEIFPRNQYIFPFFLQKIKVPLHRHKLNTHFATQTQFKFPVFGTTVVGVCR